MSLENLRVDLLDETLVLRCITIAITVLKMATLGHVRMSGWGRSRVFGAQPPERFTTNNLFAPSHQLQHHGNNGQQVARRNALGRPVNVPTSRPINSKNRQTGQRVSRSTSEFAGPFCFRPPKTDVGGDMRCAKMCSNFDTIASGYGCCANPLATSAINSSHKSKCQKLIK